MPLVSNALPYIADTPKIMGNGDNPILQDMERLKDVLVAIVDDLPANAFKKHFWKLELWDEEYISTNSSIIKQIIESTTYQ